MRRQALLLVAAVSLYFSTTAQQTHFFPKLNLVRSYDIIYINKTVSSATPSSANKEMPVDTHPSFYINRRLDFPSLKKQLGTDMQYLKIEQRKQQWQGIFQGLMQGAVDKGKPRL